MTKLFPPKIGGFLLELAPRAKCPDTPAAPRVATSNRHEAFVLELKMHESHFLGHPNREAPRPGQQQWLQKCTSTARWLFRANPSNCQPISLLCTTYKLFARILHKGWRQQSTANCVAHSTASELCGRHIMSTSQAIQVPCRKTRIDPVCPTPRPHSSC